MRSKLYRCESYKRTMLCCRTVLTTRLISRTLSNLTGTSATGRNVNVSLPFGLGMSRSYHSVEPRLETVRVPLIGRYKSAVSVSSIFGYNYALDLDSNALSRRNYSSRIHKFRKKSKKNFYDVLGITPKATQAQVKAAYYKLSKQYHPDIHHSIEDESQLAKNQEMFNEISEAYGVLGNPLLRRRYDRGILSPRDTAESVKKQEAAERRDSKLYRPATDKKLYDFDEFYQKHYGDSIARERKARAVRMEREAEYAQQMHEANRSMVLPVICLLFIGIVFNFYYYKEKNTPWTPPKESARK